MRPTPGRSTADRTGCAESVVRTYPYRIACTSCDARLVTVEEDRMIFFGARPIEVVGGPDGDAHIACPACGTMVALDRNLLTLR